MIVRTFRIDGNQRYSWIKNQRSLFGSIQDNQPSTAFSASGRNFDLNGTARTEQNSSIHLARCPACFSIDQQFSSGNSVGGPIRAIARRDPIARERRLIGSRFRSPEIRKPRGFALTHWSFLCVHFHNLIQQRGTMSDISIPGGRIRSFVERIEHLDTELQELNESKKEVFSEAKGEGLDVKILKEIIKLRKQDKDERDEHETLLDVYMRAMEAAAGPERTAKAA